MILLVMYWFWSWVSLIICLRVMVLSLVYSVIMLYGLVFVFDVIRFIRFV